MTESLRHLQINACILREESTSGENWVVNEEIMPDKETFEHLKNFILRFENLETLELVGLAIVDYLQDLT
jgi:hypothetical protein